MHQKFFICKHCGNVITMLENNGVPVMCCGHEMAELTSETSGEKGENHIPKYVIENNIVKVTVGEKEHPMEEGHYIQWICLQTNRGFHIRYLSFKTKPQVCFALCEGEEAEGVFAYCSLHNLWRS